MARRVDQQTGNGRPYAPEDWPEMGDTWSWKTGLKISVRSQMYSNRYVYLPPRLAETNGRRCFSTKKSIKDYITEAFSDISIDEFFNRFVWNIPYPPQPRDNAVDDDDTIENSSLGGSTDGYNSHNDEVAIRGIQPQQDDEYVHITMTDDFATAGGTDNNVNAGSPPPNNDWDWECPNLVEMFDALGELSRAHVIEYKAAQRAFTFLKEKHECEYKATERALMALKEKHEREFKAAEIELNKQVENISKLEKELGSERSEEKVDKLKEEKAKFEELKRKIKELCNIRD